MQKEDNAQFDNGWRALDLSYYVGHKNKTKHKTLVLDVYSFDE